jgi:hypothetical protein
VKVSPSEGRVRGEEGRLEGYKEKEERREER